MTDLPAEEILSPEDEATVLEFSKKLEAQELPEPSYHTVLQVWRDVLANAPAESQKAVTPQWAMKMVTQYPGITFADCDVLRDTYFGILEELFGVLEWEISLDPNCLKHDNAKDDVAENGHHYKNIIMLWQQMFLQYELEWDCRSPFAAVDIAALSETHKTLFGGADRTGLVAWLDNVGFSETYTEADQEDLADVLDAQRGSGE